jgi:uncharacterized protein
VGGDVLDSPRGDNTTVQVVDARTVFSPSDVNDFLECEHLSALELAVARGELARLRRDDRQADLVRRKGEEHEAAYLERLRTEGREIATPRNDAETEAAIRARAEVVYQAAFERDGWRGIADFVERLPDGSYEVADTKLARSSKPTHLLQLAFYSEQVGRIQGRLPERMHVVLGTRERVSYRVRDFDAYFHSACGRRFLDWVADPSVMCCAAPRC